MDDSFEARNAKLRDLQFDVIAMRKNVPKAIEELYEKHLEMLEERFIELNEESTVCVKPKDYKINTRYLDEFRSMGSNVDTKAEIVKINTKLDGLKKAIEFNKKLHQSSCSTKEDVRA